jgi:hypothetical protein
VRVRKDDALAIAVTEVLYGAPRDADGFFLVPGIYSAPHGGHAGYNSSDPLADEHLPLTDDEISMVVVPALGLLPNASGLVVSAASDDLLLRTVRGCMPRRGPRTPKFKAYVHDNVASKHVAATAETLENIMQWRCRVDVDCNTLLERRLFHHADFHRLWPLHRTGEDCHGHVVWCERIGQIQTADLFSRFSPSDMVLLRTQVHELMQHCALEEGAAHGVQLCKHSHIVDLSGLTIMEFRRVAGSMKPLFKLLEEQYPHSLFSLFLLNAPIIFRVVWEIVQLWVDRETVMRINIHGKLGPESRASLAAAGISERALPSWAGGTSEGLTAFGLLEDIIDSGRGGKAGLSATMIARIERARAEAGQLLSGASDVEQPATPRNSPVPTAKATATLPRLGWVVLGLVGAWAVVAAAVVLATRAPQ